MDIIIKPKALEQIHAFSLQENEGLRIGGVYVASCSLYADYSLSIDISREGDEVYEAEGIPVIISHSSKEYLSDTLIVDYNPSIGYKLASNEETYRYNLSLVRTAKN
ncbi:MAG: iron-sulfur cluster biosynthesis family protein [Bacillus sp. (in: firmicutes)]